MRDPATATKTKLSGPGPRHSGPGGELRQPRPGGRCCSASGGFVIPLVLLAGFALLTMIAVVFTLGSGLSGQVNRADAITRCRVIAESVYVRALAQLRDRPAGVTSYADAVKIKNASLLGGSFELFVEDTPGKPGLIDIYVRSRYRNVVRLFFWRVRIESSVLDATGRLFATIFTTLDPAKFPSSAGSSPHLTQIDQILQERKQNHGPAAVKGQKLRDMVSLPDILRELDVPVDATVPNTTDDAAPEPAITATLPPPPQPPFELAWQDDQDSLPVGQSSPNWEKAFDGGEPHGSCTVEDDPCGGGRKVLRLTSSPSVRMRAETSKQLLPQGSQMAYEVEAYIPTGHYACLGPLKLFKTASGGGTSKAVNALSIHNGALYFQKDDEKLQPICDHIEPDRFHHYRVEINFDNNTANVFVDGALVGENLPAGAREKCGDRFVLGTRYYEPEWQKPQVSEAYYTNVRVSK